jgi:hypothetical protein
VICVKCKAVVFYTRKTDMNELVGSKQGRKEIGQMLKVMD